MNIAEFSKELKTREIAPRNIQFSEWHDWTMVSCFNQDDKSFISELASMGIDKNPEIALMKALVEFHERQVFKTSNDESMDLTDRSDGIAAYPTFHQDGKVKAQQNAYNEAIERYLWCHWWDNTHTEYSIEKLNLNEEKNLKNEFNLKKLYQIKVKASNSNISLKIILAEKNDGGFVTGGAAGADTDLEQTQQRAFGELLRHLFVIKKMATNCTDSMSFYEKRLWGFGNGDWSKLVTSRLQINGSLQINLPKLIVDKEIIHENSDLITIHRCLFLNQPVFMGGILERLCI